jgi:hypothetical protein
MRFFGGRSPDMISANTNAARGKRCDADAAMCGPDRTDKFYILTLAFCARQRSAYATRRTNLMNVVLIVVGCILMALGLVMAANRSGYVYFVVGPRSVLVLAGVVALLAFWIHGVVPR